MCMCVCLCLLYTRSIAFVICWEENVFLNLNQLVPFIHQQEQISVKNQINQQEISIIFDGTTHVCEALAILVRFVEKKWNNRRHVS